MRRFLIAALFLLAGFAGSAQAASTINSLPPITDGTFPLTDPGCTATSTENFWITQGNDNDYKIDALRAGYLYQGTSAPSCPFKYQLWWNTAPTLPELDVYDGSQWSRAYSVDTTNHLFVPPIGGGQLPTIASSGTTDLCSTATASVLYVSGSASITSFGSTCPQGSSKIVIWQASPTVVYNATTLKLPGATNITPAAGDVWFLTSISPGSWQLFFEQPASSFSGVQSFNGRTGTVTSQAGDYSFSLIGGIATNVQLPTTGTIGSVSGLAGTLVTPNTSVTIQASSINVGTTLTGVTYSVGNNTLVFNGAITGAGGMDTGSIPANGNLCLYAIYNPTSTTTSILGVNCTTSSGIVYSGAHMPAGYTASSLLVTWPTNGTPALVAGTIVAPSASVGAASVLPIAPIGTVINASGSLTSAGTSVTINADQVVVGASLTSPSFTLGSYSQTFNGSITGAGGMDVGSLPSSGNVCLYAIFNTLGTTSILGTNCTTSSGTIYAGTHMPSGFSASALLANWATDASPNLKTGRLCYSTPGAVLNGAVLSMSSCGMASQVPPQGRLTLASSTPVMTVTVSGASTIYYTPYHGTLVPVTNGAGWTNLSCTEVTNITTNSAVGNAGPAAVTASKNYDLFIWSNAGVCTLTRAAAWTNNTTRANALAMVDGILTNTSAITNGPPALQGTYVGTVASNGASTIDYIFGGTASGGTACSLQVWNEYNRVLTSCNVVDSGTVYTYTSATIRQARASVGNQASFVLGLQEDTVSVTYNVSVAVVASAGFVAWCPGFDSTSACGVLNTEVQPISATLGLSAGDAGIWRVGLGNHFISANEASDGTNANAFDGAQSNILMVTVRN